MRVWLSLTLFITFILNNSCKDGELQPYSEEKLPEISTKQGLAGSSYEIEKTGEFFYNVWEGEFVLKFSKLPREGESARPPYSGYWYPETQTGTHIDVSGTGVSPLEKYDRAFSTGGAAVEWERIHHNSDVEWAGHCNGFASAAQRHKEPKNSVYRNGVEFTALDIKALLAEVYMGAKYFFLGGSRCEQTGTIRSSINSRYRSESLGVCEDINPGTFHAAITNWLGERKHTIIFDRSTNNEVWNFPMYYYYILENEKISEDQALSYLNQSNRGDYVFNKDAVGFYRVKTQITYADALQSERLVNGVPNHASKDYDYIVEVNGEDEIIGGEWIGQSVSDHPDFLWVALEPMQGTGTRFNGNPYIDSTEIIKMWAESVGYDPNNPPLDIMEPTDRVLSSWGKFRRFEVTVDGNSRGAAFLGNEIKLGIKRLGGFTGTLEVKVDLNGVNISKATTQKDYDTILVNLKPTVGLNDIRITWLDGAKELAKEELLVHALP